ncbi:hypothetical protein JI664_11765 [Rhodobacter sp. NTK016B]|uniref:hypothetical protein n=1 Tax=Rhodobacter sp. NTK016B TaxID=2759676 RepID=UPI001A908A6E|nr:hypothetical protein [Rhodobacter sp. NTK016B]MBN8292641.1 hypothetical protein [Rhodobacter sp. NTK016B]
MFDSKDAFRSFRASESGAVSSDWTVIAAMVCSIGLAGIFTLRQGVGDLGDGIDRTLSMAHIGAVSLTGATTAYAAGSPADGAATVMPHATMAASAATALDVGEGAHWVSLDTRQAADPADTALAAASASNSGDLSSVSAETLRARYDGAVHLAQQQLQEGNVISACAQFGTAKTSHDALTQRGLFVSDLGAGLNFLQANCTTL